MISKSEIKLITSLGRKKYRDLHNLFVAEGPKVILELLEEGMVPEMIFSTQEEDWSGVEVKQITDSELKKISFLTTPNQSLAVFKKPKNPNLELNGLTVMLDDVRDPGNLGTIIRLCDWFGVQKLVCSLQTVDCFNPKVVQATMGSLARVAIFYTDLTNILTNSNLPVFGGFMDGESIYNLELPSEAVLILGNEAHGISEEMTSFIDNRISIPRFGTLQRTESLNVATAGAILLSEFRRKS